MLACVQEYDKLKASDPDFYRAADSMSYGGAGKVSEGNIDKMVAELNERHATHSAPSCTFCLMSQLNLCLIHVSESRCQSVLLLQLPAGVAWYMDSYLSCC